MNLFEAFNGNGDKDKTILALREEVLALKKQILDLTIEKREWLAALVEFNRIVCKKE